MTESYDLLFGHIKKIIPEKNEQIQQRNATKQSNENLLMKHLSLETKNFQSNIKPIPANIKSNLNNQSSSNTNLLKNKETSKHILTPKPKPESLSIYKQNQEVLLNKPIIKLKFTSEEEAFLNQLNSLEVMADKYKLISENKETYQKILIKENNSLKENLNNNQILSKKERTNEKSSTILNINRDKGADSLIEKIDNIKYDDKNKLLLSQKRGKSDVQKEILNMTMKKGFSNLKNKEDEIKTIENILKKGESYKERRYENFSKTQKSTSNTNGLTKAERDLKKRMESQKQVNIMNGNNSKVNISKDISKTTSNLNSNSYINDKRENYIKQSDDKPRKEANVNNQNKNIDKQREERERHRERERLKEIEREREILKEKEREIEKERARLEEKERERRRDKNKQEKEREIRNNNNKDKDKIIEDLKKKKFREDLIRKEKPIYKENPNPNQYQSITKKTLENNNTYQLKRINPIQENKGKETNQIKAKQLNTKVHTVNNDYDDLDYDYDDYSEKKNTKKNKKIHYDDYDEYEDDGFIEEDDDYLKYKREMQKIKSSFRKGKDDYYENESSDIEEAGIDDIEKEERLTEFIGAKEDYEEYLKEKAYEEKKKKKKIYKK